MIDNDVSRLTEDLLRAWRLIAEDGALNSIGKTAPEGGTKLAPRLEHRRACGLVVNRYGIDGSGVFTTSMFALCNKHAVTAPVNEETLTYYGASFASASERNPSLRLPL